MEPDRSPMRPIPEVELLRRLKARNAQHTEFSLPFLESEEEQKIGLIIEAMIKHGATPTVRRRALGLLADIGLRDESLAFLTNDERNELAGLKAGQDTHVEPKEKNKPRSTMSAGEFIATAGSIIPPAAAVLMIYFDPARTQSADWVAVWSVLFAAGLIGDMRQQSKKEGSSTSIPEGLLVTLVWTIAAGAIVLFGDVVMSTGWIAFWSCVGATILGEAILRIENKKEDWSNWN